MKKFSFFFVWTQAVKTSLKNKRQNPPYAAQDEEMKWSNSDFTHLLPCKYLCRKESPLPTPISTVLVLHLLPDQLMVSMQNFYEPAVVVPHQGQLLPNFELDDFGVSPVNERKEMKKNRPARWACTVQWWCLTAANPTRLWQREGGWVNE